MRLVFQCNIKAGETSDFIMQTCDRYFSKCKFKYNICRVTQLNTKILLLYTKRLAYPRGKDWLLTFEKYFYIVMSIDFVQLAAHIFGVVNP